MGTQNTEPETSGFEKQVSEVVSQMTVNDDGHYQLPDVEMSEELKYAANAERRRRTTESTLSKTRLQLKAEQGVTQKLTQRIVGTVQTSLTPEQQVELEELKYEDPEAWRQKVNEIEQSAATTLQSEISDLSQEASQQAEKEVRDKLLSEYNRDNPDYSITDEVFNNDLPPRITNQLKNNEISFKEFLEKAKTYLKAPKKIKTDDVPENTNLSKVGGDAYPSKDGVVNAINTSYENTVF